MSTLERINKYFIMTTQKELVGTNNERILNNVIEMCLRYENLAETLLNWNAITDGDYSLMMNCIKSTKRQLISRFKL